MIYLLISRSNYEIAILITYVSKKLITKTTYKYRKLSLHVLTKKKQEFFIRKEIDLRFSCHLQQFSYKISVLRNDKGRERTY